MHVTRSSKPIARARHTSHAHKQPDDHIIFYLGIVVDDVADVDVPLQCQGATTLNAHININKELSTSPNIAGINEGCTSTRVQKPLVPQTSNA